MPTKPRDNQPEPTPPDHLWSPSTDYQGLESPEPTVAGQGFEFAPKGGYAGRGPKKYVRPDERILEEVCQRLTDSPDIDATGVEVEVRAGEVTLTGTVESQEMKHQAELCLAEIWGVKHIFNRIHVAHHDSRAA
jgi:hypothetical protein